MSATVELVQLEFAGRPSAENFGRFRAATGPVAVTAVDPVQCNMGPAEYTDLTTRVRRLVQLLALHGRPAVVIQAYCTATPLALAVAGELERAGHPIPRVQVFDPEAVTTEHVVASFCELAEKLGTEHGAARESAHELLSTGLAEASALARLREGLMSAGTRFAIGLGVAEPDAGSFALELIDRYSGWLNYLLSVRGAPFERVQNLTVFRTRACPAVAALRTSTTDLCDKEFNSATGTLNCPELIESAIQELREYGVARAIAG